MLVNLLLDNRDAVIDGYLNIDPFTPDETSDDDTRQKCDVSNLDALVDDGEAGEIVAKDILHYFPADRVHNILTHWISKLAHKGRLVLSVIDVMSISRELQQWRIDIDEVNTLLYGEQRRGWDMRKTCFTSQQITSVVQHLGMRIIHSRFDGRMCLVVCERP